MSGAIVLRIDFTDGAVSAGLVDTGTGLAQRLSLDECLSLGDSGGRAVRAPHPPEVVVPAAASAAAVAHAQLHGVMTGPDTLVLTHPADWTHGQVGGLRDAAVAAGFAPGQVTVRTVDAP
ncbi:hypothetical protein [Rhodococcus tukisamuensis]|uniref:Uncharacterized protein n=1 Tax=Rhodococcus tukisamuensis TaxID=168276 RepID=A0A1G7B7V6_9NOCA|nr:hypothetical protein [Rhodococcus tukisamuensis]SDE22927.1 hypothetical protein SAMN05444580_112108 [Rhodococcus tukisamuensis]